jgi:hypothetical protein
MSAGELESGNAGEPAKLIRQRYREASDIIKKGRMSSLFINDLDAGAGRMGDATQYTVNNQMVNATLMNIADNPTNVQLPGEWWAWRAGGRAAGGTGVPGGRSGCPAHLCVWLGLRLPCAVVQLAAERLRSTAVAPMLLPAAHTVPTVCHSPCHLPAPGVYKNEEIPRVPVVCTGNDFSTLYAPLIRDGRMEKYYWK